MAYATVQDLIDEFGQQELIDLTDRDAPATGAVVMAVADRALADASAEIDGWIAGRFDLPLSATPPLLNQMACAIARYRLHVNGAPEAVRAGYQDARATLKEIAAGRLPLVAATAPTATGGTPKSVSAAPVFARGGIGLNGFL